MLESSPRIELRWEPWLLAFAFPSASRPSFGSRTALRARMDATVVSDGGILEGGKWKRPTENEDDHGWFVGQQEFEIFAHDLQPRSTETDVVI